MRRLVPGGCRVAVYTPERESTFDEQTWAEAAHVLGVPVHDYRGNE